jgi:hypothetical protein
MKRSIIIVAAAVATALASPSVSGAQAPAGDSVVGTGVAVSRQFIVDAHSGPSGESPSGTYQYGDGFIGLQGPVTCLSVTGNRAVVGGQATSPFGGSIGVVAVIVDNGAAGPDTLVMAMVPTVPLVCPAGLPAPPAPLTSGNFVVFDAPALPTSTTQCKKGGWRHYGSMFKNQGQCVAFVVKQARQNCLAERAKIGLMAFRNKYGLGPYHVRAMRRCVNQTSR